MPLSKGYACLKDARSEIIRDQQQAALSVHILANGVHHRIAVNGQWSDGSEAQYLVRSRSSSHD